MKDFLLIKYVDKANHFVVGYLIYFIFTLLIGGWWALFPLIVIDFAKEYWDVYRHRMKFDWKDFCYTLAGAIPCIILNIIK
jgi:hypothetical protein